MDPVLERLRAAWPVVVLAFVFLMGLAAGGFGAAVLASTLAFLVVGPAYLVDRALQRRRSPRPEPKSQEEKTREDARRLRLASACNVGLCAGALFAAFARPEDWLAGKAWTVAFLLIGGLGLVGTLHVWAGIGWLEGATTSRRAWAGIGTIDLIVGLTAAGAAVANALDHWLGGAGWTAGLTLAAAYALLSAVTCLPRIKFAART